MGGTDNHSSHHSSPADGHGHGHGHAEGHGNGNGHGHGHGDHHHHDPYPRRVFSPAGGWWNHLPEHLSKQRFIHGVILVSVATFLCFKLSVSRERMIHLPVRPLPSQRFRKHNLEDDPDYQEKLAHYHQTKKPLWRRIFPTHGDEYE